MLCLLLAAALLFSLPLPAWAAGSIKYRVSAQSANLLPEASADAIAIGVLPQGTVVEITETEGSFGYCILASNGLAGWVYMPLLTYCGAGAENTEGIDHIYIKTLPEKTSYVEEDAVFSAAGLSVWAAYTGGKPDAELTGYKIYAPALTGEGEKKVAVSYTAPGGAVFSTEFTVTVSRVPLERLTLLTPPVKTEYVEGEALDLSGLTLMLQFSDGRPDQTFDLQQILETEDFIVTGCHNETHGKTLVQGSHTVNIYYKYASINCSFTLEVARKHLTGLSIQTPPKTQTVYSNAEIPDLTGLTLCAQYDNGLEETVLPADCRIECDPAAFVLGDGNAVTLKYGDKEVTVYFTFALDDPQEMKILTPMVMNFILGEPIDLTELHVYLTSASGQDAEVRGYSMSAIDPTLTGAQTITVRYEEFSGVFQLNITPYYQRGDVDGNGKISASDARLALRAAVGIIQLSGFVFQAADANRDGKITASDARVTLRAAVGMETLLDFENLVILSPNAAKG